MRQASAVLLVAAYSTLAHCAWVDDLLEKADFGLHLDEVQDRNLSLIERHRLRIDFAGFGIGVAKIPGENKIELDVYNGRGEEGRGKKMGQMIVPILMGFKVMAVIAIMFAAIGGLVLQALAAAKLSLALSAILAIGKLFGKQADVKHHTKPYFKYQQLPPLHTASYDVPIHTGLQEFDGLPTTSLEPYASSYHPSELHEVAGVIGAPSIISHKQPVISLNDQPIAVHRRQYKKPEYDAAPYKKKRI